MFNNVTLFESLVVSRRNEFGTSTSDQRSDSVSATTTVNYLPSCGGQAARTGLGGDGQRCPVMKGGAKWDSCERQQMTVPHRSSAGC